MQLTEISWVLVFNTLLLDEFLCSDGTTIIKKTQLCDDVPDCPLRNATQNYYRWYVHQYNQVAEDKGDNCPGKMCTDRIFLNIN